VIDPNMKDAVRITVIATGFERTGVPRHISEPTLGEMRDRANPTQAAKSAIPANLPAKEFQPRAFNTQDLDIPTFLRNRGH
jgi:cell division GTPase FtsZ